MTLFFVFDRIFFYYFFLVVGSQVCFSFGSPLYRLLSFSLETKTKDQVTLNRSEMKQTMSKLSVDKTGSFVLSLTW